MLLPVITQPKHQSEMRLEVNCVLKESIRLMLTEGEARIAFYYLEQDWRLSIERGEIWKDEGPAKIRCIRNIKGFWQKGSSDADGVLALDIVEDVLNLHPGTVL